MKDPVAHLDAVGSASEQDLLRLKRIARENRASPGDAENIAFSRHA